MAVSNDAIPFDRSGGAKALAGLFCFVGRVNALRWGDGPPAPWSRRYFVARIAGVNIPTNKRVEIALTYLHGLAPTSAKSIMNQLGFPHTLLTQDLPAQKQEHHIETE